MKKIKKIDGQLILSGRKLHHKFLEIGDEVEELVGDDLLKKKVVGIKNNDDGSTAIIYSVLDVPFINSEYITPDDDTPEEIETKKKKWYQKLIPFKK